MEHIGRSNRWSGVGRFGVLAAKATRRKISWKFLHHSGFVLSHGFDRNKLRNGHSRIYWFEFVLGIGTTLGSVDGNPPSLFSSHGPQLCCTSRTTSDHRVRLWKHIRCHRVEHQLPTIVPQTFWNWCTSPLENPSYASLPTEFAVCACSSVLGR